MIEHKFLEKNLLGSAPGGDKFNTRFTASNHQPPTNILILKKIHEYENNISSKKPRKISFFLS